MRPIRAALAGLALFGLAACENEDPESIQPVRTQAPILDDEEIELLAIRATWDPKVVCPGWRQLMAATETASERQALEDWAIAEFEDGYGESLSPAGERLVLSLLENC